MKTMPASPITFPLTLNKQCLTSQAAGAVLPAQGVALQVGIQQAVPVVLQAPLPRQQQVLHQEAGADDAAAVVQPACAPQLAHAGIHHGVPRAALPPRLHTRLPVSQLWALLRGKVTLYLLLSWICEDGMLCFAGKGCF